MSRRFIFILGLASAAGCEVPRDAEVPVSAQQAPLLGAVRYGADCTAAHKNFLGKSMHYARTVSVSAAFVECVDSTVRARNADLNAGPYLSCSGDPDASSPPSTQIARVLDAARAPVDLAIGCTGGDGYASAFVDHYAHLTPETLRFSSFLNYLSADMTGWPYCNGSNFPNCRVESNPWPWSEGAQIVWHEALHQQGYSHGTGTPEQARSACGYAGYTDAQWNYQRNTMPYIVDGCMRNVLTRSGMRCGTPLESGNGLNLISSYNSSTCAVVQDPHMATVSWQYLSTLPSPVKIAACTNGKLYSLTASGLLSVNNTGGSGAWTSVTTVPSTRQILCASNQLYAFNVDRTLWRNNGTDTSVSWGLVGQPSGAAQITGTSINYFLVNAPVFYALNDDHSLWRSDTGANGSWTLLGHPTGADRIAAGGNFLDARPFALNADKSLWLNAGDGCDDYWHFIDLPWAAAEITASSMTTLYALNSDRTLWRGTVNNSNFLVPTAFGQQRHCNGTQLVP